MKKFCGLIVDNMAILIILISILGAAVPASLKWVGPHVPWMLGVVMFGMGMTLRFEDFHMLAKRPWEVGVGALAQFTLMPLIAWALVKLFALPPDIDMPLDSDATLVVLGNYDTIDKLKK